MSRDHACITMTIDDHNNARNDSELTRKRQVSTLADLVKLIAQSDLPAHEIGPICSAIRRVDQLVGHGALDLPANLNRLLSDLARYSPAMAGISRQSLANLKSRLRKAFRIAQPHLPPARSINKLSGEWLALWSSLSKKQQRALSRFFHHASAMNWSPHDVSDAHIERFAAHLQDAAIVQRENVVRQTVRKWNRVVGLRPELPLVTPLPTKRTPYWISSQKFTNALQGDIEAFLFGLSSPSLFSETSARKLEPGTISQYNYVITTLVSALVADGLDVNDLDRLNAVVRPGNLKRAFQFLHRRADGRVTPWMLNIAVRAKKIASWSKLTPDDLHAVSKLVAAVKEECPPRRAMTKKNRTLVDLLDDARFRDNFVLLPKLLLERAKLLVHGPAASMARTAIAAELLTMCSMRRENLIALELEKNIRRIGEGANTQWVIEFLEEEVKNGEPLRYLLPQESAKILEHYLEVWRPQLCTEPTSWLFPNSDGEMLDPRVMTEAVKRHTKHVLGVPITPHQFRQLGSELYLRDDPRGLTDVSHHLGHRDYNTARRYYTTPKQRSATRRYQEHIVLKRSEMSDRRPHLGLRMRNSAKISKDR